MLCYYVALMLRLPLFPLKRINFRMIMPVAFAAVFALYIGAQSGMLSWSQAGSDASQTATAGSSANGYGIAASFDMLSPAELETRMGEISATGATWVRYDLSWNRAVEQGFGGAYNWTAPDRVTASAKRHGLQILMVPGLTPAAYRMPGCSSGERCAPTDVAAYVKFVKAAAERYGTQVQAWEIWNEPNISYRFGPSVDVTKYVNMLKGAYKEIKLANPEAIVLGGSIAPTATTYRDLRPLDFVNAMYEKGASGYFDGLAMHPYTYPIMPNDSTPADAWGQMKLAHEVMAEHGDGDKKIWITEFSAPTNGPNLPGEYVDEDTQADILAQAATIYRGFDWSGPFMWYELKDSGTSTVSSEYFYGLKRADGTTKPAYNVWLRLTSMD